MTKQISLTQGKFALVDDADYEWLNQWKWQAAKGARTSYDVWYAVRCETKRPRKRIFMHRVIMSTPEDMITDHVDHDGLNNQRYNLRSCTKSQNTANSRKRSSQKGTSKYKGVSWNKGVSKWQAEIQGPTKRYYLGLFLSAEDAAIIYDKKAIELFGDFAYVNFRSENIGIYPPDLFAKTKAKFISLVKRCVHPETVDGWNDPDAILERAEAADLEWRTREPVEARVAEIEEVLRDPFMDKQTAFTLLGELAELDIATDKE
jgi:hypothetical protein